MSRENGRINTITFTFTDNVNKFGEDVRLSFDIEPDMPLEQLHRLCKYFASALGYGKDNIENLFGPTEFNV